MTEDTTMLRVSTALVEEFRKKHKELEGLNMTQLVDVMLRKALEREAEKQ